MKKNILAVWLILLSLGAFAQRHSRDPKAMADKQTDRMKTALLLNDDQYSKIKAINESFGSSRAQVKTDRSLTNTDLRDQLRKLAIDHDTQLRTILTTDQWSKWTALRNQQLQQRKNRRRGGTSQS
jgi:protein CpxP